jgi:glycosyltransferase involved in cell wall biosynthesis
MKILLFANTDWYLYNFRLALALALKEAGHEVVLVSPPGEYGKRLLELGLRWEPFPFSRRGANPFAELATIFRLASLYRREKPRAVHHFTVKCVLYGSAAARMAGVRRVVNSITGLGYVFIGQENRARIMRGVVQGFYRLVMRGTAVIFQNEDDRALFLERKLVAVEQAALIKGSGVDIRRFQVSPLPAGEPVVILPGRMLYAKGVSEFVEAARILRAGGTPVRFTLVGDTDTSNPDCVPLDILEKWQKESAVEWWGWQEDMAAVYARCSLVCLPSYREGLPRTLLEAAACGRAAVASDVPGCREIVRAGVNGLLVPVRDATALAEAVSSLLQDPERMRRMGLKGRQIVEEEYSSTRIVNETLQLYRQVVFDPAS